MKGLAFLKCPYYSNLWYLRISKQEVLLKIGTILALCRSILISFVLFCSVFEDVVHIGIFLGYLCLHFAKACRGFFYRKYYRVRVFFFFFFFFFNFSFFYYLAFMSEFSRAFCKIKCDCTFLDSLMFYFALLFFYFCLIHF